MAGGRPTKYNEQLLIDAQYYLDNYEEIGDLIPSIAGLAGELKITRETVRAWSLEEDKTEFSAIVKQIMIQQERKLINGGLGGTHNAMIGKLLLSKHGYSDKQEIDHTSGGEKLSHPGYTIVDE